MRHEVNMPQLGMTQDSGVIVSWTKKPGDAVKADDVLMEVETDKSTMEVEAGREGYLAEVRAKAGEAVPVGDVVAVISDSADDVVADTAGDDAEGDGAAAQASAPQAAPEPAAPAAGEAPASPPPAAAGGTAPRADVDAGGRILASPKAKMEARRRGIDLARLARRGARQPFHVADLETLEPDEKSGRAGASALAAAVDGTAFASFCEWASGATEEAADTAAVWAAFASASWRAGLSIADDERLAARVETIVPLPSARVFVDADSRGLAEVLPTDEETEADLVILDLTGSGLCDYRSGGSAVPTVTVAEDGDGLRITLGFDEAALPVAKAAAVLAALAGRVREPLRHLL